MLSICHRLISCTVVALLTFALPAAADDVNKYLPDDADIVMVINVKQLMQAPLVQKYAPELLKKAQESDAHVKMALTGLGFDPLKDLTTVTVTSTVIRGGMSAESNAAIILEGTFDAARLEALAEAAAGKDNPVKVIKEGEHKIFEVKYASEPKPMYAGIVDKSTIVLATEKSYVLEAFDRAAGKKTGNLKKELATLIAKANPSQSVWLVAPASVFVGPGDTTETLKKIDHLNVGFSLTNEFKMAAAIVTKSADATKEVTEQLNAGIEQLKGILALMADEEKKYAVVVDLIGAMRVTSEGVVITLKTELSQQTLEKLEKNFKSGAK
jgi:hypothetical protein